ncbi:hypothetical protein RN001_005749 [Aquatica leii]|uniref:Regulatory protein zeste n=1 Tax=Aquatica leii TaxID=1421715 RepID=A0AAN7P6Z3_9COLE|nr:hypothetical protein RN001_005749 [Aquatica leii]
MQDEQLIKVWEQLTAEFNSASGDLPRTTKSLKIKYDSIKKDLRKKKAANRQQIFITGGGTPDLTPLTTWEEKLLEIILLSCEGLPATNDCDTATAEKSSEKSSIKEQALTSTASDDDITDTETTNVIILNEEKSTLLSPQKTQTASSASTSNTETLIVEDDLQISNESVEDSNFKFYKKKLVEKRESIAANLNAVPGGVQKSWSSWKKSWQDIRSRTKNKLASIKRHSNATGGGEAHPETMTELEEDLLAIIKPVFEIEGHQNVSQSMAEYSDTVFVSEIINMESEAIEIQFPSEAPSLPSAVPSPSEQIRSEGKAKRPRISTKTVKAVDSYEKSLKTNKIKESYYKEKLAIMREMTGYEHQLLDTENPSPSTSQVSSTMRGPQFEGMHNVCCTYSVGNVFTNQYFFVELNLSILDENHHIGLEEPVPSTSRAPDTYVMHTTESYSEADANLTGTDSESDTIHRQKRLTETSTTIYSRNDDSSDEENIIRMQVAPRVEDSVPSQSTASSLSTVNNGNHDCKFKGFTYESKCFVRNTLSIYFKTCSVASDIMRSQQNVLKSMELAEDALNIPCSIIEDFKNLNQKVEQDSDVKNALAKIFRRCVGLSAEKTTRAMLKILWSPEVAVQYNWEGRRNKLPIKDLAITKLMQSVLHNNPAYKHTPAKTFVTCRAQTELTLASVSFTLLQSAVDIEELQRMLLESDDDDDKFEFENESDLDKNDHVEVCSGYSDNEDVSGGESEQETNENEYGECYLGKDKVSKWMKRPINKYQIRKQPQNILSQLPLVRPRASNAKTELETWNCFISEDILDMQADIQEREMQNELTKAMVTYEEDLARLQKLYEEVATDDEQSLDSDDSVEDQDGDEVSDHDSDSEQKAQEDELVTNTT